MLRITVARYQYGSSHTRGLLFFGGDVGPQLGRSLSFLDGGPTDAAGSLERASRLAGEHPHVYHTIENPWKDNQRMASCIPRGVYPARIRPAGESENYPYRHIHLEDVEDRTWILIHVANYPSELSGCIAPGMGAGHHPDTGEAAVWNSRKAHERIMGRITGSEFDLQVVNVELGTDG